MQQIQVGLMESSGTPVRGIRCTVIVATDASASAILHAAVSKLSAHVREFNAAGKYILRYPNGQQVDTLLESNDPFTLEAYKMEVMKDYAKIVLYATEVG